LKEFFASCGDVTDCKVIMDRNTGRSKGFGFVTFSSAEGPVEAKKKSGEDLSGLS
jgi:RNA recognition motif-containing protein